jgi:hypothetical protein
MVSRIFAAGFAVLCLGAPVLADDPLPDSAGGRYTFNKTADGVVRLDTKTGEVALCSQRTVGWACQAAPEDRAAFESEIARLRSENAALKQSLLAHGLPLPGGMMPDSPAKPGHDVTDHDITIHLPDDAEIDRAMAYLDRMWRNFVDTVQRAQKQLLKKS